MKEAEISIHGNSLTPEAIRRLAARVSPERLGNQRQSMLEAAMGGLLRMREDCEYLGRLFGENEPETATTMITGLDMFTDGFMKLVKRVESAALKTDGDLTRDLESKVVYIE